VIELLWLLRKAQPTWNHWINEHGTLVSIQRHYA